MKTAQDPRHLHRIKLMQELFSWDFQQNQTNADLTKITSNLSKIDHMIAQAAPTWPINKINKVDLAILRLAVSELAQKVTPTKVIVDEAVELAKEYGTDSSPSFINGVLGKLIIDNHFSI